MSIFDKINDGHKEESEQLRIEALMKKAPEHEKAMFGDLLSNLVLQAD